MRRSAFVDKQLTVAEGYIDLGMFFDAWNVTENLPAAEKSGPTVIEVRLRIATALEKWELGRNLALALAAYGFTPPGASETAARFPVPRQISAMPTPSHPVGSRSDQCCNM